MEAALNLTAERLGESFAEIESRRQELAAMLDSMQEAVVAITPEGLVRWSNAVMQRIAGTQIRRRPPAGSLCPRSRSAGLRRAALEQREVRIGRASSLAPGRIFEINAAPLPSGGALVVLHDVTRIEAAEKSRRDFIANVSHELRTPLTSIQGYVETLVEDPLPAPETTREFLGVILKNATRMNRLTEDLLALASVESPDYKLAMQPIRASALVQDAIESLGGIVVDSGVELQSGRRAGRHWYMADPDAMNQVFGNLIENALKYGKAGKRIRVGARLLESRGRVLRPGLRPRHRLRASRSHLRALLSRRQSPLPRVRRHRPRPGHRQAHRPGPRRPHLGRKRTRQWRYLPLHPADSPRSVAASSFSPLAPVTRFSGLGAGCAC